MQFLRRQDKMSADKVSSASEDPWLTSLYPAVAEFLTAIKWDDGKRRETGTMMLLAEHGLWKLWLHDRDAKRSCWLTGQDASKALDAAEVVLRDGVGEWRPDKR